MCLQLPIKNIFVWLYLATTAILIGGLLYLIVSASKSDYMPQDESMSAAYMPSRLAQQLPTDIAHSPVAKFPFSLYLSTANLHNIRSLKDDLRVLDSVNPLSTIDNRRILSMALTDSLKIHKYKSNNLSLDSLISLVQWASKFKVYETIDTAESLLYTSIAGYWLDYVVNENLTPMSENEPSVKFTYKYKYLKSRCEELRHNAPTKITNLEKVLDNLIKNKWAHLIDASWNETSKLQKMVFFMLIAITLYAYVSLFQNLYKRIKNVQ